MSENNITISAKPTADPRVCKFVTNRELHNGDSVACNSPESAAGSVLFEELFSIADIREVLVHGNSLTVANRSGESWRVLGAEVGKAIRCAIESGRPLIADNYRKKATPQDELVQKVEDVLREKVNPYVAGHGGKIAVTDIRDGIAFVELTGGCQGCAAASVTLRQGVERILVNAIPEIVKVVDTTDHSLGQDPYYRQGSCDHKTVKSPLSE